MPKRKPPGVLTDIQRLRFLPLSGVPQDQPVAAAHRIRRSSEGVAALKRIPGFRSFQYFRIAAYHLRAGRLNTVTPHVLPI